MALTPCPCARTAVRTRGQIVQRAGGVHRPGSSNPVFSPTPCTEPGQPHRSESSGLRAVNLMLVTFPCSAAKSSLEGAGGECFAGTTGHGLQLIWGKGVASHNLNLSKARLSHGLEILGFGYGPAETSRPGRPEACLELSGEVVGTTSEMATRPPELGLVRAFGATLSLVRATRPRPYPAARPGSRGGAALRAPWPRSVGCARGSK